MNAIVIFLSEEVPMELYNDPDYRAIMHYRLDATSDTRLVILHPYEKVSNW